MTRSKEFDRKEYVNSLFYVLYLKILTRRTDYRMNLFENSFRWRIFFWRSYSHWRVADAGPRITALTVNRTAQACINAWHVQDARCYVWNVWWKITKVIIFIESRYAVLSFDLICILTDEYRDGMGHFLRRLLSKLLDSASSLATHLTTFVWILFVPPTMISLYFIQMEYTKSVWISVAAEKAINYRLFSYCVSVCFRRRSPILKPRQQSRF